MSEQKGPLRALWSCQRGTETKSLDRMDAGPPRDPRRSQRALREGTSRAASNPCEIPNGLAPSLRKWQKYLSQLILCDSYGRESRAPPLLSELRTQRPAGGSGWSWLVQSEKCWGRPRPSSFPGDPGSAAAPGAPPLHLHGYLQGGQGEGALSVTGNWTPVAFNLAACSPTRIYKFKHI